MRLVFSKRLTKIDVYVRLSFPMKLLNVFEFPEGKDMVEFEVTDHTEKSWKFCLSRQSKASHGRPKPVLSSGWLAFVQAKGLKRNDSVILYVEKDTATETRFKIRAQRRAPKSSKLAGKENEVEWVDIEKLKS